MRCEFVSMEDENGDTKIVRVRRPTPEQLARRKFWDELGEEPDPEGSECGA